ncbi:MAG: DUF4290 domain-containing protein [Bacteroidaceae bacterium]|nr:DUF4290 domain-containing protein [Bacteroidaceae bacterium]
MQYNIQKDRLVLSGYGRMVQEMVQHAMTIEDRDERNRCARTIVRVMGQLTDQNPEQEEGKRKLWDHLAEISNYGLDIDYPVEVTPKEERESRPEPLPYPMRHISARHYGSNVEAALARLAEMPESPTRDKLTGMLANQMKRLLAQQTKDTRHDERVHDDITHYTEGKVTLAEDFRFLNPNTRTTQGSNALNNVRKKKKK